MKCRSPSGQVVVSQVNPLIHLTSLKDTEYKVYLSINRDELNNTNPNNIYKRIAQILKIIFPKVYMNENLFKLGMEFKI